MTGYRMTTTEARPGGKAPARTDNGWHYDAVSFPVGQHTPGSYPGQRADVYARHTGRFALDVDAYKEGNALAWEQSAAGRYLAGRQPYVRRGLLSFRYLVAMTPDQAAVWWPAASGMPWGEIRAAGLAPSPGSVHPSGDTYEAVPGPDAVTYPDGLVIMTNVIQFDDDLKSVLIADGAHSVDDRAMMASDAELPADDGRCPLALTWLKNAGLDSATTPRGEHANRAVNYLKRMTAEGHQVGGIVGDVIALLPHTSEAEFAAMWATAPVPADTVKTGHECCDPGWGFGDPAATVAVPAVINGTVVVPELPGAVSGQPPGSFAGSEGERLAAIAAQYAPVDWVTAWRDQPDEIDWLFDPLLEVGTVNALFAKPGTGKSLLAQEIAFRLARSGRTVVYVDDENRVADVVERFQAFGATPRDLANLRLYSFARLPPLDTPDGGLHLLALAATARADLVILDTTSRMVAGRENDSDTFISLYRNSLVPLKQRGTTVLRLDHPGKDEERGQRGSSAKDGDVDTIWRLSALAEGVTYRLDRTKSRSGHGEASAVLTRHENPLRHSWSLTQLPAVTGLVKQLNDLNLPPKTGRPAAREALAAIGVKVSNRLLEQAIRQRKQDAELPGAVEGSSGSSAIAPRLPPAPQVGAGSRAAPGLGSSPRYPGDLTPEQEARLRQLIEDAGTTTEKER